MDLEQKLAVLKKADFLTYLRGSEQTQFIKECKEVHLKPGGILFHEKDPGNSMYVILSGEVLIYKENKVIARRGDGEIFGELSLIDSAPRSATVESVSDASFLEITKEQFHRYFASNSKILFSLLKIIAHRFIIDIHELDSVYQKIKIRAQELEESNQELQSFAYIASHDLQEPLRKIVAFGDRLSSKAVDMDEEGKKYLERMQYSASRMKDLIHDLLQYSNVMVKESSFELMDLNNTISDVLVDLEDQISRTHGQINVEAMPTLEAVPFQMRQLFLNLIGNALKYHKNGVNPIIRITSSLNEDGNWNIWVEDNGIGIDEKYFDRVFKVFERLHNKSDYEGTGIGLTICKRIVNRHGGRISLKSQLQKGTRFKIILPAKQALVKS